MRSQYSFIKKILPGLLALPCCMPLAAEAQVLPGLLETPATKMIRPLLTRTGILNLLPERGKFAFPAPYNTQGVRVTNEEDCKGTDCVSYLGYSYWNNINNHVGFDSMLIFVGLESSLGGGGPTLFEYNKLTDQVTKLGPLFDETSHLSTSNGDGWYFSGTGPTTLYIPDLSSLLRYDVITQQMETVVRASDFRAGAYLWQMHSSADDRVHSGSLRSSNGAMLGCAVYREDTGEHQFYPRIGDFDECQIDKSGDWLVIKEDVDGRDGEDNRIINVNTGHERILLDRDGAGGHSDLGHGYMVATDNWAEAANTIKLWNFNDDNLTGKIVYTHNDWNVSAPDHIAHGNSSPNLPPEQQYACGSSANRANSSGANEIICFGLDGSRRTMVVAPVMTNLDAGGSDGSDYAKAPKGNIDVTGKYFIWTSNMGGDRLDVFVTKIPNLLDMPAGNQEVSGGGDYGTPSPPVTRVTAPAPVVSTPDADDWSAPVDSGSDSAFWANTINAAANGGDLVKSGGCDGCRDAGAQSVGTISEGNGYLEFSVSDAYPLQYLGLSSDEPGMNADAIDFGLRVQGGYVEVRENGRYRSDVWLESGDTLRIAVQDGQVSYLRNGTVFYTSTNHASSPLRTYASMLSEGSAIQNARLVSGF